eukprot:sb/3464607/
MVSYSSYHGYPVWLPWLPLNTPSPGVEHTHHDLRDNWDPEASYDFNSDDADPAPELDNVYNYENMQLNNYSSSQGRKGKGSIFVWASGNGGRDNDDCNMDGYVSSIYTIAISALNSHGLSPWYSEWCSATLASAYSSGFGSDGKVWTTDIKDSCTDLHTGTSAATPLAAGVIALALQANPDLTWRDVQHLIVNTASKLTNADQWTTNGAGHAFHPKIGFGALGDPSQFYRTFDFTGRSLGYPHIPNWSPHFRTIPGLTVLTMSSVIKPHQCANTAIGRTGEEHLNKLEHVQLVVTMNTAVRGNIKLLLTSPSGTTSKLLNMRPNDKWVGMNAFQYRKAKDVGIKNWAFMSVNFWDENPYGKWKLEIFNGGDGESPISPATRLKKVRFMFYGTGSKASSHSVDLDEEEDITGDLPCVTMVTNTMVTMVTNTLAIHYSAIFSKLSKLNSKLLL